MRRPSPGRQRLGNMAVCIRGELRTLRLEIYWVKDHLLMSTELRPYAPTNEHHTVSPNRDFQDYPDLQDTLRNAWTDTRASKNADTSANVHAVKQLSAMKYMSAHHHKPEVMPQEPGLHPHSEQSKNRSMESTLGYQKPTLRSITSPLIAHRLKPIRQKTKKAVVCQLFF